MANKNVFQRIADAIRNKPEPEIEGTYQNTRADNLAAAIEIAGNTAFAGYNDKIAEEAKEMLGKIFRDIDEFSPDFYKKFAEKCENYINDEIILAMAGEAIRIAATTEAISPPGHVESVWYAQTWQFEEFMEFDGPDAISQMSDEELSKAVQGVIQVNAFADKIAFYDLHVNNHDNTMVYSPGMILLDTANITEYKGELYVKQYEMDPHKKAPEKKATT